MTLVPVHPELAELFPLDLFQGAPAPTSAPPLLTTCPHCSSSFLRCPGCGGAGRRVILSFVGGQEAVRRTEPCRVCRPAGGRP